MVEGSVPPSKIANVDNFKKQAKEITAGLNPRTASISVSAKLGPGDDYKEIQGIVDIYEQKETNVSHKPG